MASASDPAVDLKTRLSSWFTTGELSDLTVRCGVKEWKVHKLILCAQSTFFHKACTRGFRVCKCQISQSLCRAAVPPPRLSFLTEFLQQEGKSCLITLDHDPLDTVSAMLEYLYRFSYSVPKDLAQHSTMQFHTRVYIIAEKYNLPALKDVAAGLAIEHT